MKIRLLTRWGSYFQGDTVSVSVERAHALADAGIGRILEERPEERPEEKPGAKTGAPEQSAPAIRDPARRQK